MIINVRKRHFLTCFMEHENPPRLLIHKVWRVFCMPE